MCGDPDGWICEKSIVFVAMRRIARTTVTSPSAVYLRLALTQVRVWSSGQRFWLRLLAVMPGPLLLALGVALHHPERGLVAYNAFFLGIGVGGLAVLLNVVIGVRLIDRRLGRLENYARDDDAAVKRRDVT